MANESADEPVDEPADESANESVDDVELENPEQLAALLAEMMEDIRSAEGTDINQERYASLLSGAFNNLPFEER